MSSNKGSLDNFIPLIGTVIVLALVLLVIFIGAASTESKKEQQKDLFTDEHVRVQMMLVEYLKTPIPDSILMSIEQDASGVLSEDKKMGKEALEQRSYLWKGKRYIDFLAALSVERTSPLLRNVMFRALTVALLDDYVESPATVILTNDYAATADSQLFANINGGADFTLRAQTTIPLINGNNAKVELHIKQEG